MNCATLSFIRCRGGAVLTRGNGLNRRAYVVWHACVLLTACGDPLVAPELIADNRVLGARVEAVSAPERAWLAPSERGSVSWLVVGPKGLPSLGWACSLCAAKAVSRGLPRCSAKSFAQFSSEAPTDAIPRFEFSIPDEQTLAGADQIAVFGAFCSSGVPTSETAVLDPTTSHCPDPSERPLLASMELPLSRGTVQNRNPSFGVAAFGIDGENWPGLDELADTNLSCADGILPRIQAGSGPHALEVSLPSDLSEPLPVRTSRSPATETLQLAHFTTGGDLERAYSVVDEDGKVRLTWRAPEVLQAQTHLIRFYFVLRDGRGGLDWERRAVCVVP